MAINTLSVFPTPAPLIGQSKTDFVNNASGTLGYMNTFVGDFNGRVGEVNTVYSDINVKYTAVMNQAVDGGYSQAYLDERLKSGFKNLIINGDFRINQRNSASKTANSSQYNYDRWYYDGTNLVQKIENLNYIPNTVYTLSGTNVSTSQVTSPASGIWNIVVPSSSNNVQLEIGTIATEFEQRHYGLELSLCQRYFQRVETIGNCVAYSDSVVRMFVALPVTLRVEPTSSGSVETQDGRILTGGGYITPSSPTWDVNANGTSGLYILNGGFSGLTANESFTKFGEGYIDLDAEL